MLHLKHFVSALDKCIEDFKRLNDAWQKEMDRGVGLLNKLARMSAKEVRAEMRRAAKLSALPSDELDKSRSLACGFSQDQRLWRSHEGARRWAAEVLSGRTTYAADGGQALLRELIPPVAVVQIASFENPHCAEEDYRKEVKLELITPAAFCENEAETPEAIVNFRRFSGEIEMIEKFIEDKKGWQTRGERAPVAFFDGSLFISYAQPRTRRQDQYIEKVLHLVRKSDEARVPIVGYIDQSQARDLVKLLDFLAGDGRQSTLFDSQLLRAQAKDGSAALSRWGDRTIFFYCMREGIEDSRDAFLDESGDPRIGFVYLQTTRDAPPARLDIPSWVYREGLLEEVVDVVRAECVVGNGYPYAIESADATAVITGRDLEQAWHLVQEFASRAGLQLSFSRKAASKIRRH
jgi:hypothetical protein